MERQRVIIGEFSETFCLYILLSRMYMELICIWNWWSRIASERGYGETAGNNRWVQRNLLFIHSVVTHVYGSNIRTVSQNWNIVSCIAISCNMFHPNKAIIGLVFGTGCTVLYNLEGRLFGDRAREVLGRSQSCRNSQVLVFYGSLVLFNQLRHCFTYRGYAALNEILNCG